MKLPTTDSAMRFSNIIRPLKYCLRQENARYPCSQTLVLELISEFQYEVWPSSALWWMFSESSEASFGLTSQHRRVNMFHIDISEDIEKCWIFHLVHVAWLSEDFDLKPAIIWLNIFAQYFDWVRSIASVSCLFQIFIKCSGISPNSVETILWRIAKSDAHLIDELLNRTIWRAELRINVFQWNGWRVWKTKYASTTSPSIGRYKDHLSSFQRLRMPRLCR